MDHPLLTIAIPAYRRAQAIRPLLQTLADQAIAGDDLVVIDDASGDDIEQVVSAVQPFRLIKHAKNVGMVANWNACLHAAKHDWVCIVHHDDMVAPGAVEILRRACALAREPALIAHRREQAAVDTSFRYRWCEPGPWAILNAPVIPSGAVIHRQIVAELGPFDARWKYSADLEFFPRICTRFPLLLVESPDVVRYFLHGSNHQYRTWQEPDFASQLEEIERLILRYAQVPEAQVGPLLQRRMAGMYRHMFIQAGRLGNRSLVRQLGRRMQRGTFHGRKSQLQAMIGALLGWYPGAHRNQHSSDGVEVTET